MVRIFIRRYGLMVLPLLFLAAVAVLPWYQKNTGQNAAKDVLSAATDAGARADTLSSFMTDAFVRLDKALSNKDTNTAKRILVAIQDYQQQILPLLPQLLPTQKAAIAKACQQHVTAFKASVYTLPEASRIDGLVVLAGCNAIQDIAG